MQTMIKKYFIATGTDKKKSTPASPSASSASTSIRKPEVSVSNRKPLSKPNSKPASSTSNSKSSESDSDSESEANDSDEEFVIEKEQLPESESEYENNRKDELDLDDDQIEDEITENVQKKRKRGTHSSTRDKSTKKVKKLSKKKHYFREEWAIAWPWVESSSTGRSFFRCTKCNTTLSCQNDGITAVKRHEMTKGHIKTDQSNSKATAESMFNLCTQAGKLKERANILELQVAMFIAKHNLPLSISDDFIAFLKAADINKHVQQKLKAGRTKTTALIQNVLGQKGFDDLVQIMRRKKFSLIIDESTDISSTKHLVLGVRYLSESEADDHVCDEFLTLIEVEHADHRALYQSIVDFFNKNEIPYKTNMVGFSADGASVMFGAENSVAARFREDIPTLFTFKCICHSLALAVSYAVRCLPPELEELMSQIYCYLKYSSKRQQALNKLQELLNIPEHKILKILKVRWLSLATAVDRYVEQYDALFSFFEKESLVRNNHDAKKIFDQLRSKWTFLYLKFLNYILPIVCKRNIEFQSETPKIPKLYRSMEQLFKTVVGCYMKEDYVDRTDPEFIEFEKENDTWEPLRNVDFGPYVLKEFPKLRQEAVAADEDIKKSQNKLPDKHQPHRLKDLDEDIIKFQKTCRQFLITLASQIYKRFPFREKPIQMLKYISFLDPILLKEFRSISCIAEFFKMDIEEAHRDFKELKRTFIHNTETDFIKFWKKVRIVASLSGEESGQFRIVLEIVDRIMVLPHSSATCERVFSTINLNKTKVRNKLSTNSLIGLLHCKRLLKSTSDQNVTS